MMFSLVVSRGLSGAVEAVVYVEQTSMVARSSLPASRDNIYLMLELCMCASYAAGPLISSACLWVAPSFSSINPNVLGTGLVCLLYISLFILIVYR